jgi:hypothetical protein
MSAGSKKPTIQPKHRWPFMKAVLLAHTLWEDGLALAPACWERQIDTEWWLALNAHTVPMRCSHGYALDSMEVGFEYRGEAVAYVHESSQESAVINHGSGVTDEMLLTARDRAIARACGAPLPLQSRLPQTTTWRGVRYADGAVVWRRGAPQRQETSGGDEYAA